MVIVDCSLQLIGFCFTFYDVRPYLNGDIGVDAGGKWLCCD